MAGAGVFVLRDEATLVAMQAASFATEDDFQRLRALSQKQLAADQIDREGEAARAVGSKTWTRIGFRIATVVMTAAPILAVAVLSAPISTARAASNACRVIPVAERPAAFLQAFASRMRLGSWIRFYTDGSDALYMSPGTDVRVGIDEANGFVRMATVLATDIPDRDWVRFQTAATFLLSRIAGVSEETARESVSSAIATTSRTGQDQSVTRGEAVLLLKRVESNGLIARVFRRSC